MQKKDKPKIGVAIITFNEENNLVSCLDSIKWVDEIVIVDSYSKDDTVTIAKKYTKNIYYRKFEKDFSSQRNFALDKMFSDWIIVLDADESLPNNSENIIRKLICRKEIDGCWITRINYVNQTTFLKQGIFFPDSQLRLFRNSPSIRFIGKIHEKPTIDMDRTKVVDNLRIIHNHTHTKYDKLTSFFRLMPYIEIEANELANSNISRTCLLFEGFISLPKWIKRSFITLKGYDDGLNGFRAAFIYGLYRTVTYYYAFFMRI